MISRLVYSSMLLVMAIVVMAILLDVKPAKLTRLKRALLYSSVVLFPVLNLLLALLLKQRMVTFYPLLIQLPTALLLLYISGRGVVRVFFVLLTAVLLSYPAVLSHTITWKILELPPLLTIPLDIVTMTTIVWLIWRYMAPEFRYAMEHFTTREVLSFCTVPVGYNIINYVAREFISGMAITPLRLCLFVSVLGVYFMLMNIFKTAQTMDKLESEKNIVDIQMETAKQHIDSLRSTQQQTMTYRHDLRHHLSLLSGFAESNEVDKIRSYLANAQQTVEAMTPRSLSSNSTMNLILSSFASKAERLGVTLSVEAALPQELGISDGELCAVLANGLENAVAAAAQVEPMELRRVEVNCAVNDTKLMLEIKNPYVGTVEIKDGLPQAESDDRGFGARSIASITQLRSGHCSFHPQDGIFTLQVVLPLD